MKCMAVSADVRGKALCLLREVHGGLAAVSVCNLHRLRPTSETQNCEKNKLVLNDAHIPATSPLQDAMHLSPGHLGSFSLG